MISHDDLRRLLLWLDLTDAREIDCDEFLARVGGVIERLRPGEAPPPDVEPVLHHLRVCPECDEEFEALLRAVRDEPGEAVREEPGELDEPGELGEPGGRGGSGGSDRTRPGTTGHDRAR